jgi:heme O synthase-like polyprenyltransferase
MLFEMQQRRNLLRWLPASSMKSISVPKPLHSNRRIPAILEQGAQHVRPQRYGSCCYTSFQLRRCCTHLNPHLNFTNRWKYHNHTKISIKTVRSSLFMQLSTTTPNDDDDAAASIGKKTKQVDDMKHPISGSNSKTVGMRQYIKAYGELSKWKLSSLVVATTAAGYIAAGPIPVDCNTISTTSIFIATIVGTSFCSGCASGYNQIYERTRDRQMKRTQARPLVTGILSPSHAMIVTSLWGIIGTTTLYHYTDPFTTALGLGNIILYAGIYTPLKPITIYNTWIGAMVGAIPPLMGYTAAKHILYTHNNINTESSSLSSSSSSSSSNVIDMISSSTTTSSYDLVMAATTTTTSPSFSTELFSSFITDPIAISLVSTLYFWQLPHFMALSYMYRIDYKRGGFMMVPTAMVGRGNAKHDLISENDLGTTDNTIHTDSAGLRTANIIVRYAWYLSIVPIFSTTMDVTSSMYLLESILLNAYALRVAYKFRDQQTNQNARSVFLTSLWYLPCTLMLFLLHSKVWDDTAMNDETTTNKNVVTQFVSEHIHSIRNKGRELCIHEQAIVKNTGATTKISSTDNINNTEKEQRDESICSQSETSCPVMIVRKTDPNNIHLNIHPATTAAMASTAQETSTKE